MLKYDVTTWSDYVRGLLDEPKRAELAAHLELPGSESARRTVAAFGGLMKFVERDAATEPPHAALRQVKALGSLLRPQTESSWLTRLRSVMIFDSAATPLAAGVRDLGPNDRQLIFRSDNYFVDLRLEPESASGSANLSWVLVGQLLHEADGVVPVAGVSVLAASQDRFVGRSRTGPLGEFQTEGLPASDLRLLFLVNDELCLEVPVSSAPAWER